MVVALNELYRIPTSGARAVTAFTLDGLDLLAIAQLARDVPDTEAHMNGGDSATDLVLMRRTIEGYEPYTNLPAPGGEDVEFFRIGERAFLAVASIRVGRGPYSYDTKSQIFEWNGAQFVQFQAVPSFAAKQWKHWRIDGRDFLGLAQGVQRKAGDQNRDSVVFEWDGAAFVERQRIPSRWAYNWHAFAIDQTHFVAHAEHLGPSVLYRWDGERLEPHQSLVPETGRSFVTFEWSGDHYLVAAAIAAPSRLMRWDGERFEDVQTLDGLGGRELAVLVRDGRLFVVRINFILGTPADPRADLDSQIYEWRDGSLEAVAEFPTCGGTDVAVLERDGGTELIVANSLTPELRFATDCVGYSFEPGGR